MHDYHDALPGFSEEQVLIDGCAECEWRAEDLERALSHFDSQYFRRACQRATAWRRDGLTDVSDAELKVFRPLSAVLVRVRDEVLP